MQQTTSHNITFPQTRRTQPRKQAVPRNLSQSKKAAAVPLGAHITARRLASQPPAPEPHYPRGGKKARPEMIAPSVITPPPVPPPPLRPLLYYTFATRACISSLSHSAGALAPARAQIETTIQLWRSAGTFRSGEARENARFDKTEDDMRCVYKDRLRRPASSSHSRGAGIVRKLRGTRRGLFVLPCVFVNN